MELICLEGSPWSAKVLWILDACSINIQKRPFEPFVDEIWLRYKLGLWPWQRRYWTRLTVPIAIVQPEGSDTGGSGSCVLTESMDIAEWALRNAPGKEPLTDATLLKLRYWNDLSDVILQFGRAAFVEAAKRDVRVAIEVLSPPWMKRLPHFLTKLVMTVALRVFAMKYRRENAQSKLEAVMDAVKRIRAALKEGGGQYLVNGRHVDGRKPTHLPNVNHLPEDRVQSNTKCPGQVFVCRHCDFHCVELLGAQRGSHALLNTKEVPDRCCGSPAGVRRCESLQGRNLSASPAGSEDAVVSGGSSEERHHSAHGGQVQIRHPIDLILSFPGMTSLGRLQRNGVPGQL